MIQHRGSLNNIFINNAYKLKTKQGETQPRLVLNLKKRCVCFSKKQNKDSRCLKKIITYFVKPAPSLLNTLLIDFIILIRQKIVKIGYFIYKTLLKKNMVFQKKKVFL
tara:strand:+ start:26 stop:349 length:324 start_codon:yes stop_codon:yes gene_type:complete